MEKLPITMNEGQKIIEEVIGCKVNDLNLEGEKEAEAFAALSLAYLQTKLELEGLQQMLEYEGLKQGEAGEEAAF